MAIVNGPGAGGSGGGLIALSSQLLANRQATDAQRIQDQQEREAIRARELLDQEQRRRDASLQQRVFDSETTTGGPGARGFSGNQTGFASDQDGSASRFGPADSQRAPGGGFAGFGQAPFGAGGFQSGGFEGAGFGGFENRVRPRPSSTFLAQAIGQELRPGGDQPRAEGVASLYRQTQSAVTEALQRRNGLGAQNDALAASLLGLDRPEDRGPVTP
ncbi:MAG: hypothetical protein NXI19_16270 [Alphaproteobacteria bacterium]|nr:hypothetical protein [Alphaproteobacteria bacterium]